MSTHRRHRELRGARKKNKMQNVGERDGWVCWICERPVDVDGPADSPRRASLDHIVPLHKGGANHVGNLRIAHRQCNEYRWLVVGDVRAA